MAKVPDIASILYSQHDRVHSIHCTTSPSLSLTMAMTRDHLRQEILAKQGKVSEWTIPSFEEDVAALQRWLPQLVEITGLDLLLAKDGKGNKGTFDDCSYDSYAVDSQCLIRASEDRKPASRGKPDRRKLFRRQVSDMSIASRERPEICPEDESYAENSVDLNRKRLSKSKMTRRLSSQTFNVSGEYYAEAKAGDDVMENYEMEQKLDVTTKPRHLPTSSYSDYANDSVIMKRPENSNDDDGVSGPGDTKDSMDLQRVSKPRRGVNPGKLREGVKRSVSASSCSYFSLDVYESQTINTGGASRAA